MIRGQYIRRVNWWSHCFGVLLSHLFLGDSSLATSGMVVTLDEQPTLIFATLTNNIADLDGHREALTIKDSAGLKPCIKCSNATKNDSDIASRAEGLVDITCHDVKELELLSDDDIFLLFDLLEAAKRKVDLLEEGALE